MAVSVILLGVILAFNLVIAGKHDLYSGYSVHGIKLRDASDRDFLHDLVNIYNLDIWEYGTPALRDAMVMVPAENRAQFLDHLDTFGVTHYLHRADVAKNLEEHDASIANWKQRRSNKIVPFEDYPRYAEVDAYMERIAAEYPSLVTIVNAGPSFEGRAVKYLKISTTNFTNPSKPIYFMDAMIHAREWVTTPVSLYTIHRLVEDLRDDDRDLLDNIDWIVFPIVNPDGYEYSHTDDRLWRRTRSYYPAVSAICYGVDGNRNFNISFNTLGVSTDPCSNTYPGHEPFSEVEMGYVRDILLEHEGRIQVFLDIHSHGNYVLFGYGDNSLPDNAVHIHHVAAAMGAAIDTLKLPQAGFYLIGNSGLVLYPTSGSAQDYAQMVGAAFSFTLELPGYGYAFLVPPEFIEQINVETWRGIAVSARIAVAYYRGRQN